MLAAARLFWKEKLFWVGFTLPFGLMVWDFLTYLRHRLTWWRLHPIGFSIASVWQVKWTVFTLFVA